MHAKKDRSKMKTPIEHAKKKKKKISKTNGGKIPEEEQHVENWTRDKKKSKRWDHLTQCLTALQNSEIFRDDLEEIHKRSISFGQIRTRESP